MPPTPENYPAYPYTKDDARAQLARFVRLDNPDSYPFDHFHAHEYNEIMFFTHGGGTHNINFKAHAVQSNAIHLLAARDLHWLERAMDSAGFAIVYKDQFLHKLNVVMPDVDFHAFFSYSKVINLNPTEAEGFQFLISELLQIKEPGAYQLQLIGAFLTKIATLNHPVTNDSKTYDPLIVQVVRLIETHFKTHKTVAQYADLLHVSGRTLQSRVRKASGYTVGDLIAERTLKEAKKMLCTSGQSVKEIAYELGFAEASHFSNWFKKKTGFLPKAYKYGN